MDTITILIGILAIMAFIVPIALFKRAQRRRAQLMLADFEAMAQRQGLALSHREAIDQQLCLGLDTEHRVLLRYTSTADGPHMQTVRLADMARCRVNSSGDPERGAHTIGLALSHRDGRGETIIDFYSSTRSNIEPDEAKAKAERWQQLVAPLLSR